MWGGVKMARMLVLWLAAFCVLISGEFHVPSRIQYEGAKGSDFGFALAYQKSQQKLFVGKPRVDLDGGVESCPIWSYDNKKSCNNILNPKNMKNIWGEFSREVSPNQHFLLGATVAATPDYVLTMRQKVVKLWSRVNHIATTTQPPSTPSIYTAIGSSLGWSALVDEENDTLLISKPTGNLGSFMYTRVSSPLNLNLAKSMLIEGDCYIGSAMTSGVFFSNKGKIYANAWEDNKRMGFVGFLHLVNHSLKALTSSRSRKKKLFINSRRGRNMFGASLHMADFTGDRYSELVVGAPAEPYRDEYEAGAIYIYRGGDEAGHERSKRTTVCVHHNKAGSRFGTALASLDLDSDDLPELFISAPYEAKGGAVYVMSGAEVRALFEKEVAECNLHKKYYQILSSEHKSFGFVLQPALNFDNNGGNVLAVGAPLAGMVILYRSIPAVKVEISVKLKDKDIVRELDKTFSVTIIIGINYPAKQNKSSGHLFVETSITTDLNKSGKPSAVPIIKNDQNFTIDLSQRKRQFLKDIVVEMKDDLPHTYDFSASVKSDESLLNKKEFSESLIRLSDNSVHKYNLRILRRCRGDECVPRLTMALKWSQSSDDYVLGSSVYETITVAIKNDGNSSYESCAKVHIAGAKIADWSCDVREISDICRFQELKGSAEHSLTMKLDMSKVSYRTKELDVAVSLYSKCSDQKPTKTDHKTIKYILNTDEITVNGSYFPLNVTDRDIADTTSSTVGLLETFTIKNEGSVVWEELQTEITILKKPYIQDFLILNEHNIYCLKQNDTDFIKFNCSVNLDAKSYIELKTQVNIAKDAVVNNLKEEKLLIFNTDINVNLSSTEHRNFSLDATAMYLKDSSFKNHMNYILIVAILVSIIVLLIIGIILYKCGFFERNTKKELNELKKEWKRRSTMGRPESAYQPMNNDGELHIEEVDEDYEANSCTIEHPNSS